MQFNSWEFFWFTIMALAAYWLFYRKTGLQNALLMAGSYYFYSCLHISFPLYLLALTVLGYFFGQVIEKNNKYRKTLLVMGLVLISSCLVFLKYTNFGISIVNAFGTDFSMLKILVPVGLSFYTFSSIGYITDVYRRRITAERSFFTYGAYISFFPHLLAGPIAAATTILPQFRQARSIKPQDVESAVQQIVWGLFKKMVIADNISIPVNYCFAHSTSLNSTSLYLGIVLFSFQIYADFSGYSDIARGVAKLFGIDLYQNFKSPFLSRNPAEFWRRWHTSLTKWLTDYLYKPMGGRSHNKLWYTAILLFIFLFSGLWHGANWTFVLWGLLNGIYFLPYIFTNTLVRYKDPPDSHKYFPAMRTLLQILLTFHLITFSRILFKSTNLSQANDYFMGLVTRHSLLMPPKFLLQHLHWCLFLVVIEWINRFRTYALDFKAPWLVRYAVYASVALLIILYHKPLSLQEYYYFRF